MNYHIHCIIPEGLTFHLTIVIKKFTSRLEVQLKCKTEFKFQVGQSSVATLVENENFIACSSCTSDQLKGALCIVLTLKVLNF